MALRSVLSDPMLRMLALAIVMAIVVPATGTGRAIADGVANAAIFLLFLLNGMRIARRDIAAGIANWRFLLPLVIWVFGIMALAGLGVSKLATGYMPSFVALGFIYLGILPSTVQSATSYSTLAGGNAALSVVSAALLNMIGIVLSAPLFAVLGGVGAGAVGWPVVMKILTVLLLPFVIGLSIQNYTTTFIAEHKPKIVWIDRFVIAIAIYVAFSGAVEQGIWQRIDGLSWVVLIGGVAAVLAFAHGGAWLTGGLLRFNRPDRISFLFAGAQKSAAIGVPLATVLFPPATAGFVVLPLLLYHLFQLVIAAPIAGRLALAASPPR